MPVQGAGGRRGGAPVRPVQLPHPAVRAGHRPGLCRLHRALPALLHAARLQGVLCLRVKFHCAFAGRITLLRSFPA